MTTSLAPAPLPAHQLRPARDATLVVATGEHDVFLPPARLSRAASRTPGTDVRTPNGAGHLAPEENFDQVVALVEEVSRCIR